MLFNHFSIWIAILLINVIPGLLGSILFRRKNWFERILIGISTFGLIIPLLQFILGIIGIHFTLTLIIVPIVYIVLIYLAFKKRSEIKWEWDKKQTVLYLLLSIVLIFTFLIRFQSFSPVYQELDPYFYAYGAYQLFTQGTIPPVDNTAWYPLFNATHRTIPIIEYLEADYLFIYSKINHVSYTPYLLSAIENYYPPLAATFMVFYIFLLFSDKNKWIGLIAALITSFLPVFIIKMMSGVFEAQPFGFFSLTLTITLIYYALKEKDLKYTLLAGLGFAYTVLGSVSYIILIYVLTALSVLFIIIKKSEFNKKIAYISLIGLIALLLLNVYRHANIKTYIQDSILLLPLLFDYLRGQINKLNTSYIIIGTTILVIIILISPIGNLLLNIAIKGLSVGQYNNVLERTIQEQQLSSGNLIPTLGKLGDTIHIPIVEQIIDYTSQIIDLLHKITILIINKIMGTEIILRNKQPSLAFIFIALYFIITIEKLIKKEFDNKFLISAILFYPIFVVGLVKAKYEIFFAYSFLYILFYTLEEINKYLNKMNVNKEIKVFLVILLLLYSNVFSKTAMYLTIDSLKQKFSDNPHLFKNLFLDLCSKTHDPDACSATNETYINEDFNKYNPKLCFISKIGERVLTNKIDNGERYAVSLSCNFLSKSWLESMKWIQTNTEQGSRITSWWDYGHWINFFGMRNAVIRNEHTSLKMILDVAHSFVMGNETELRTIMKKYNSSYVLIDREIIMGGNTFGGKFYALNYLACAHDNLTNKETPQMKSKCELNNLWETVYISNEPCIISNITHKYGLVVYAITDPVNGESEKRYCLSNTTLATGQTINALFYLNETTPTGDLKLNKGILLPISNTTAEVIYTKDKIWLENGTIVDGWEDRKGRFYDSVIYKGFVLGQLDGFTKVFDNGYIKIYKMN